MKTQRKTKITQDSGLNQKSISQNSLSKGDAANDNAGEDWLPSKALLKPVGQLILSEKEMDEELTRILNANNPHAAQNYSRYNHKERIFKTATNMEHHTFHFEFDGYLIYKGEENSEPETPMNLSELIKSIHSMNSLTAINSNEEANEEDKVVSAPLRNQFNYSERAAQTVNNPFRERSTNTDPPPMRIFSHTVNQWSIFDAYVEDLQQKERLTKKVAPGGTKGHKDDEKQNVLPAENHAEDVYYKNPELRKSLVIMERMVNQNTFDDITQDYKYWEDASDELGDKKAGTLLPLWKFVCEKEKKKQVTSLCWNPKNSDLFAVGYGSYDFSRQCPGIVGIFTLKNPSNPEFMYITDSGVMCLHFHPQHPSFLAVGLYDGSVAVYNLQKKIDVPIYKSFGKEGCHSEPVWQVRWQGDDLDDNLNFYSVSSDGRIVKWVLLKNDLNYTDVISLKYDPNPSISAIATDEDKLFDLAGGCCFDFHKKIDHLFIVGTEEGRIHKCSKDYNNQYLLSYEGHQMAVYNVQCNPFNSDFFLSASADWNIKLWDHNEAKPIMTFDLNSSVGDVAWAPYSSTVFAAVTSEGKVFVFDLNENKYGPVCEQQIVKKSKLTHVAFNPFEPILIVGDDRGTVISLKLSPNLRKKNKDDDDQAGKLERVLKIAMGKSI